MKDKKVAVAEIIAIGNELIIGRTLDTNTNYIARRLTELGVHVKRAIIVRDDIDDIIEAINLAMKSTSLIITTGGLGPTDDDLTLKAISKALDRKLELNEQALEMVKQRYDCFYRDGFVDSSEVIPSRKKMAILIKGGIPIFNPVGAAPGVIISHKNVLLCVLPGVPREMEAVFDNVIEDIITKIGRLERTEIKEIITDVRDESKLSPILKSIQQEVTGVFLKSIATHFGKDVKMKIRIMAYGKDIENRMKKIRKVEKQLRDKYAIKIMRIENKHDNQGSKHKFDNLSKLRRIQ